MTITSTEIALSGRAQTTTVWGDPSEQIAIGTSLQKFGVFYHPHHSIWRIVSINILDRVKHDRIKNEHIHNFIDVAVIKLPTTYIITLYTILGPDFMRDDSGYLKDWLGLAHPTQTGISLGPTSKISKLDPETLRLAWWLYGFLGGHGSWPFLIIDLVLPPARWHNTPWSYAQFHIWGHVSSPSTNCILLQFLWPCLPALPPSTQVFPRLFWRNPRLRINESWLHRPPVLPDRSPLSQSWTRILVAFFSVPFKMIKLGPCIRRYKPLSGHLWRCQHRKQVRTRCYPQFPSKEKLTCPKNVTVNVPIVALA